MTTHPFHPMSAAGKLIAPAGDAGNLTTDTTYTKIFVGGLAWETQRDTMRRYFEQFGEILEAVVITDKNTGRSKGYGFVTFKEPESATRACENPSPVIDGRRANCNLAFLGASNRSRHPTPQFVGIARFRPPTSSCTMTASAYRGAAPLSDTYYHQPAHYTLPYSVYGYSAGYSQETLYPVNYYGVGGQQQQFSPYYSQATPGFSPSYHPYRAQYSQSTPAHGGLSMHYPQMIQYPYLPQQFGSSAATVSLPTSINAAPTAGLNAGSSMASSSLQPPRNTSTSDQNKTST